MRKEVGWKTEHKVCVWGAQWETAGQRQEK